MKEQEAVTWVTAWLQVEVALQSGLRELVPSTVLSVGIPVLFGQYLFSVKVALRVKSHVVSYENMQSW